MIDLDGYILLETVATDEHFTLIHGVREKDNLKVLILSLNDDNPNVFAASRFDNAFRIVKEQNLQGVLVHHALEIVGKSRVMILEDFEAVRLDLHLKSEPVGLDAFFRLVIRLTMDLGYVHQAGLVHNGINSANLLFDADTEEIRLVSVIGATPIRWKSTWINFDKINVKRLAYFSPELTGRLNRLVDGRSDLYSLGILFYEILTGSRPFNFSDPGQIVHAHIARQPPPLDNHAYIPGVVSDIVLKLLSKNPDDRYQTASGLAADLSACYDQFKAKQTIELFPLAQNDNTGILQLSDRLYGREDELQQFDGILHDVFNGKSRYVIVDGYPGVGKTSLVNEVKKQFIQRGGYFIIGTFFSRKRQTPYVALIESVKELVVQFLNRPEAEKARIRAELLKSQWTSVWVTDNLIPEWEWVVGRHTPEERYPVIDLLGQFVTAYQKIIDIFATADHPLAVCWDNFQWADADSIAFLDKLFTHQRSTYLMQISVFRNYKVLPNDPAAVLQNKVIDLHGHEISLVSLQVLKTKDLNLMLSDILNLPLSETRPLAALLKEKTDGNPFFTKRFLEELYSEKLLYFDRDLKSWNWELEAIRKMSVSDNVATLLIRRFQKLPPETRQNLEIVSCLGLVFELLTLVNIRNEPVHKTMEILQPAIDKGFLIHTDSGDGRADTLRFSHIRLQRLVYDQLDTEMRQKNHLVVGRYLWEQNETDIAADQLFEIVDHLNMGKTWIEQDDEKYRLARLNLDALNKALVSAAYERAELYGETASELLPENHWQVDYELSFALFKQKALIEIYLKGREKIYLLEELVQQAQTDLHKIELYDELIDIALAKQEYDLARKYFDAAIRCTGISIPTTDQEATIMLQREQEKLQSNMKRIVAMDMTRLPYLENPMHVILMRINISNGAILLNAMQKYSIQDYLSHLIFNLTYDKGTCEYSASNLAYISGLQAYQGDYETAFILSEEALQLSRKYDNIYSSGHSLQTIATFTMPYQRHLSESIKILKKSCLILVYSGNYTWVDNGIGIWFFYHLMAGTNLSQLQKEYEALAAIFRNQFRYWRRNWDRFLYLQSIRNLLGLTDNVLTLDNKDFNEAFYLESVKSNATFSLLFYQEKLRIAYLFNDLEQQVEYADRYFEVQAKIRMNWPLYAESLFFCGLIYLARYHTLDTSKQEEVMEKVHFIRGELQGYADICPDNFSPRLYLIEAEEARVREKSSEAMVLYDKAIDAAGRYGFVNVEAIANEAAGRYYLSRNLNRIAGLYLGEAYRLFGVWGVVAKVNNLEKAYPQFFGPRARPGKDHRGVEARFVHHTVNGQPPFAGRLDLNSIMKASQAISGEIVLEKLASKLLTIIIESAGAERGVLLLNKENSLYVEAEGYAETGNVVQLGLPVADAVEKIPLQIISKVSQLGESVVLDDAANDDEFAGDPYIKVYQPRSVLCLPVVHQQKTTAVFYFENNLCAGAFTSDRQEILHILSSQAAISLENAALFQQRVIAEKKTNRLRQDLKNIIDSMPSVLVQVDQAGTIVHWNTEAAKITGLPFESVVGLAFSDVFPLLSKATPGIQQAIDAGSPRMEERIQIEVNNRIQYMDVTVFPLVADAAKGAVIRVDDVTSKVRMEEMIIQSEKMLSVGGLAAGMAHEINNPLAGIIQNIQVIVNRLKPGLPKNESVASEMNTDINVITDYADRRGIFRSLESVMESGKRASGIVQNMLSFSRKGGSGHEPHQLDQLLDTVVEISANDYDLKKHHDFKTIEIVREYESSLPTVYCEGSMIQQVFLNILKNGAQAMKTGGSENEPNRFYLRLIKEPSAVRIEIEDNGSGMDETIRKRIFEPFFTTKDPGEGTGLGLSVSYFIITENHKGTMTVESPPGKGANFIIRLPLTPDEGPL